MQVPVTNYAGKTELKRTTKPICKNRKDKTFIKLEQHYYILPHKETIKAKLMNYIDLLSSYRQSTKSFH